MRIFSSIYFPQYIFLFNFILLSSATFVYFMRNSFFFYIYIHRIILNGSIIQREKEKAKTKMDNLFIRISSHFYVFHSRMSVASPSSNTIGRILFPNCPFTNSRFLAKHKQRSIEIPVAKHTDIESFNFQPSNARDTFPNDSPPVRARPMIAPRNKTESVARGRIQAFPSPISPLSRA